MDIASLETYYEKTILPKYLDVAEVSEITWKDHGKVGPDAWAHYFEDKSGREYVLLYEDFPGGEYLEDNLTHEIVLCGNETSIFVENSPNKIENVSGYFTLYREKKR